MRHFEAFIVTGQSFEDKHGEAGEHDAAVGMVCLSFAYLQIEIARATLAAADAAGRPTPDRPDGFAERVEAMRLALHAAAGCGPSQPSTGEMIDQSAEQCLEAWRLYRQVTEPVLPRFHVPDRRHITLPFTRGVSLDAGNISDISDFVTMVAMDLDQFVSCDLLPAENPRAGAGAP